MTASHPSFLLVNPGYSFDAESIWASISSVQPPLGIASLAATLEKNGFAVAIKDFQADSGGYEIDRAFLQNADYDYLGISATTPQTNAGEAIAALYKQFHPRAQVIFGGVHPTTMPDEVLTNSVADIVVRGEGELTLLEIAQGKPLRDILGISYKTSIAGGGGVIHNPDRPFIENLDDLPNPAYHLLPMSKYHPAVGSYKRLPAINVMSARGCPGVCTYCHRQMGKRVRSRSGRRVAEEVKYLHETYGINEISFYDDTFTANKDEVYSFIAALKEFNLDMTWCCFSRVDAVDAPLLAAMAQAGCHQLMFGVESANKEVRKNIKKGISLERVKEAVRDTKNVGIEVRVAFMLGNPGETRATIMETIRFANELDPDLVIYNMTTPYPGTEMFKWADDNGYLLTKDWRLYDLRHPVMELPTISNQELSELYTYAYRKFYWRPRYLCKRLKMLRSFTDIKNAFKGLLATMRT
ncbi:B12-binding domain-containing radical SAM protein [Planctomycetales bacterium]|nr:B12-binding domain-containing radical SAM protein [Planctomycetales bacterium]